MKFLYTFILIFAFIFSCGYLVIHWHNDAAVSFEKLCIDRPSLKGCPDKEIGGAL